MITVDVQPGLVAFRGGVVVATGVSVAASTPALAAMLDELVTARAKTEFPPPALKEAVRDMLRTAAFKPTGRNKPASEYLAQAAREGRFPRINNLVDINNLLSLKSGLPISMLDLDVLGDHAEIRLGRPGEKYVFNAAGQEIELEGLLCACAARGGGGVPLGNAIKDSMAGKIKPHTTGVVAFVYGATEAVDGAAMGALLEEFAKLLREHAGAGDVEAQVVG